MIPQYLISTEGCEKRRDAFCRGDCAEPVKMNLDNGRWFITMGHPGFNSTANNGYGYSSARSARAAIKFFSDRHERER